MKSSKILFVSLLLILTFAICLTSCGIIAPGSSDETNDGKPSSDAIKIEFTGNNYTTSDASAVKEEGYALVIVKPGTYSLSGTLNDGQIIVRVTKEDKVKLELNGFTASCSKSSVIYVESANKVSISTITGTTNTLSDAEQYVFPTVDATKPNACIYSKDDLTISGDGTLIINANYKHGIATKNDLKIKSGHITIKAVSNALRGNESVTIEGGAITVTGCEDGIKTTNELKEGKGSILVTGGSVTITANDDALQATQSVEITGGLVTVTVGGDAVNCDGPVKVAEGCLVTANS